MLSISYDGPSAYFRSTDDASPIGPCDACQFTSTRSSSALRLLSTGRICLFRLCSSRESASLVSCWIVLGYHPFRGFSLLAPQSPLGLGFPPCRFPILRLSQLRGFQLSNQVRSPLAALFTPLLGRSSLGRFLPFEDGFRPRPTLLPDSSHGLLSCLQALLPVARALFRVS